MQANPSRATRLASTTRIRHLFPRNHRTQFDGLKTLESGSPGRLVQRDGLRRGRAAHRPLHAVIVAAASDFQNQRGLAVGGAVGSDGAAARHHGVTVGTAELDLAQIEVTKRGRTGRVEALGQIGRQKLRRDVEPGGQALDAGYGDHLRPLRRALALGHRLVDVGQAAVIEVFEYRPEIARRADKHELAEDRRDLFHRTVGVNVLIKVIRRRGPPLRRLRRYQTTHRERPYVQHSHCNPRHRFHVLPLCLILRYQRGYAPPRSVTTCPFDGRAMLTPSATSTPAPSHTQ